MGGGNNLLSNNLTDEHTLYMNINCLVNRNSEYCLIHKEEMVKEEDNDCPLKKFTDSTLSTLWNTANIEFKPDSTADLISMNETINMGYVTGDGLVDTLRGSLLSESTLSVVYSKLL